MTFCPYPVSVAFPESYYTESQTLLETALASVPGYNTWRKDDPDQKQNIDLRFAAMPILTKEDLRAHFPKGFLYPGRDLASGLANKDIEYVKTSGTTGEQVTNIWHQPWWNKSEVASWKLNRDASAAATSAPREAILASPLSVGFKSDDGDLPIEKRRLDRFLFLNDLANPLAWTDSYMDRMIDDINTFKPVRLEANPSLLSKLCRYITKSHRSIFQPSLIVITYELMSQLHLKHIRAVFNSPVVSSYGTTETGYVFMECEAGKFHQNIDFCRVDFQPLKKEHGGPFIGRILVTVFKNPWTALIRFNVGDLVHIDESQSCSCGRKHGLILSSIEGRTINLTLTTAGIAITQRMADEVISSIDDLEEYKLIRTGTKTYDLLVVCKDDSFSNIVLQANHVLKQLYGQDAIITIRQIDAVTPEVSGKYRIISSELEIDEEAFFENNNYQKSIQ
jgi:phenylacetate-CoA ligase